MGQSTLVQLWLSLKAILPADSNNVEAQLSSVATPRARVRESSLDKTADLCLMYTVLRLSIIMIELSLLCVTSKL